MQGFELKAAAKPRFKPKALKLPALGTAPRKTSRPSAPRAARRPGSLLGLHNKTPHPWAPRVDPRFRPFSLPAPRDAPRLGPLPGLHKRGPEAGTHCSQPSASYQAIKLCDGSSGGQWQGRLDALAMGKFSVLQTQVFQTIGPDLLFEKPGSGGHPPKIAGSVTVDAGTGCIHRLRCRCTAILGPKGAETAPRQPVVLARPIITLLKPKLCSLTSSPGRTTCPKFPCPGPNLPDCTMLLDPNLIALGRERRNRCRTNPTGAWPLT